MAATVLKTVKASGGDYTSLSAWAASISGRGTDLTTRDVVERVECYPISGGDTTAVSISGLTTDAARRVEIAAPASNRHGGKWNTSAYYLSTTNAAPLTLTVGHVVVDGLQFKSLPTYSNGGRGVFYSQVTTATNPCCYFVNCIFGESNSYNTGPAFACSYTSSGSSAVVVAAGCLVHSSAGVATGFANNNASRCTLYCYNCTVKAGGTGFSNATTKNCLANGVTDGFNNCTGDYNVSSVSSDAPGSNSRVGSVTFVDAANYDFHLSGTDTVAKGYGTNLSSDSIYALTKDIDDQTISTWSIGADAQVGTTGVTATTSAASVGVSASVATTAATSSALGVIPVTAVSALPASIVAAATGDAALVGVGVAILGASPNAQATGSPFVVSVAIEARTPSVAIVEPGSCTASAAPVMVGVVANDALTGCVSFAEPGAPALVASEARDAAAVASVSAMVAICQALVTAHLHVDASLSPYAVMLQSPLTAEVALRSGLVAQVVLPAPLP